MSSNGSAPTPQEAADQAAEYLGFATGQPINIGNGEIVVIPYPGLMSDEQQQRYNELQLSLEELDHDEVLVRDANRNPVIGADGHPLMERVLKDPPRKKGKPVEPYNLRLCRALFGEELWARMSAAGVQANHVNMQWIVMHRQYEERRAADSKSGGSITGLAAVPRRD